MRNAHADEFRRYVEVKDTGDGKGRGVFAKTCSLKTGRRLGVYTGRRLAPDSPGSPGFVFEFNASLRVDGDQDHWSACLNDIAVPNVTVKSSGVVYQTRAFHVGDELGFHYGRDFWASRAEERL
jgi:hypothetical protein